MQYVNDIVGLAVLGWPLTLAIGIILCIALATLLALYFGRRSTRKWLWGWSTAVITALAFFWDYIPTVLNHEYYCGKESGFAIYKSIDEWKAENLGVLETLFRDSKDRSETTTVGDERISRYLLNQRFNILVRARGPMPFHLWRYQIDLIDVGKEQVIGRYIDFSTMQVRKSGGYAGWKFWLYKEHCDDGRNARESAKWMNLFGGEKK